MAALETNGKGTAAILGLAERHGNKKVIFASSSEVYGKLAKVPFREDDDSVLGPTSVTRWGYACSKAFDEFLALAYNREKGLPVVALRFFNTVGPRQTGRYGMVMPRFVSQAVAGDPITVYGDGEQMRSFTYVKDVVKAVADIAAVPSADGQVFNVGTDKETSMNELAQLVCRVLSSPSEIVHIPFSDVYGTEFEETRRRSADISKIQRYIEYHPSTDLPLALIHRRTACRRPAEERKGCASESGIMVLKQKTGPRKGAPDRCYHVTTPTASKSPSTTTAWWPMPG